MADNTSRSREVQRLTQQFQAMLEFYENACRTQPVEARFTEIVEISLHDMTKNFRKAGIIHCPDGQEPCPDGSGCVPRGRICPDSDPPIWWKN